MAPSPPLPPAPPFARMLPLTATVVPPSRSAEPPLPPAPPSPPAIGAAAPPGTPALPAPPAPPLTSTLPTVTLPVASTLTLPPKPSEPPLFGENEVVLGLLPAPLPPRAMMLPATRISPLNSVGTTVGRQSIPQGTVVALPMVTSPADPPKPPWPLIWSTTPSPPEVRMFPLTFTEPGTVRSVRCKVTLPPFDPLKFP